MRFRVKRGMTKASNYCLKVPILHDESVPWVKRVIAEGAKGPVIAEIKCLRAVSARKENRLFVPKSEIWVYIRKHEDGTIKYFISNKPADTEIAELDRLATARWSIVQCFHRATAFTFGK